MKSRFLASIVFCSILFGFNLNGVQAEEGGAGHYLPGSMASFIDGVPLEETFIVRFNALTYDGSIAANRELPIAGLSALGVDADSQAFGLSLLWRPPLDLGNRWSYAMSATIPFLHMKVSANVATPLANGNTVSVRRSDSKSGLGDIILMPLMLNYNFNPDFNVNFRTAIYAPTGSYKVGRLANTGKNFWTLEPTLAFMYFGQKNGREASLFVGADFNWENPDTDYKSGTQFHVEGTLAQHFPLAGGLAGVGLTGYYYKQLTGDSGSGANFGDFEGKTVGLGPALSYTMQAGNTDVIGELKWLHETGTENRLQGDTVFLKVVLKY
jgi:hypothetical protein